MSVPWHQRGIRVHKFVYRTYYIIFLLFGVFLLLPALMLPILLALGATVQRTIELVLMALPGLFGILFVWVAIHRLRRPIKATR
jgi:hypothetical protein